MKRFPPTVREAMQTTGAQATCLPVRMLDGVEQMTPADSAMEPSRMIEAGWESAIFFQVGGPESKEDRRILRNTDGPISVAVEADLIENSKAAVVVIRFEILTRPDDPLAGEVLIAPGLNEAQFQTCKLLTVQPRLRWHIADAAFWVIRSQEVPLPQEHRTVFGEILDDATSHDAVIRMTGTYDGVGALGEIASRYELREGAERSEYATNRSESDGSNEGN